MQPKRAFSGIVVLAFYTTLIFGLFACGGADSPTQDANQDDAHPPGPAAIYAQGWLTIDMTANSAETKLDSLGHFDTSRNACGREAYGNLDVDLWNQISDQTNKAFLSPSVSAENNCFPRPDGNKMDGTVDLLVDPSYTPAPGQPAPPPAAALMTAFTTFDNNRHTPDPTPTPTPTNDDPDPVVTETPIPTPTIIPTTVPTIIPTTIPTITPTVTPTTHPTITPTSTPTHTPAASPSPSPTPKRALFESRGDQICTTIKDQQLAAQLIQSIGKLVDDADKQDCANGWGH
jgi:hypothetical protein